MINCLYKVFMSGKKWIGGCLNFGCVVICFCGGGYKKCYCKVDFCCDKVGVFVKVVMIEYDLNCLVCICLLYYCDGEKCYILWLQGLKVGDIVVLGIDIEINVGNVMLLCQIFFGMLMYNFELKVGKGGQLVCSVGMSCQLMVKEGDYVQVCLLFGEVCCVYFDCYVMVGIVGNGEYLNIFLGKVGCICWKGCCLYNCGVIMNLVDYLMGGGEGCLSGGCYFMMFWGKKIKGLKIWCNKCIDSMIVCCCKWRR